MKGIVMVLSCKDISKSFGADTVLNGVTFVLEEKEKAAVVGVNGAGKTTLFRILTGELTAEGGSVVLSSGASLGYMAQIPEIDEGDTVYTHMLTVFAGVIELEGFLRETERRMSEAHGDALHNLMGDYDRATHEFEQRRGYEYKSRIRGVLKGLGFSEEEFDKPLRNLSGGQKTRAALGALLLREPEVLLLDEPTNHLDLDSIQWLEGFLSDYPGSLVIISHDRYFLDNIVTKVIELDNGRSFVYNGNYSFYARKKETDREISIKHYLDQQKEIKRQEAVIAKLRSFNREKSIKRAESREKLLDKMVRIEKPQSPPDQMRMALTPKKRSGLDVLTADCLSKSYGEAEVFKNVSFEIKRGEKAAIIGPNGVGKTTLFKILMGELPADAGGFVLGSNVNICYYDQEHENLEQEKTLFQELSDSYPKLTVLELRNVLAAFMFTGDEVHKRISMLSGGERGRLALAKIMLGNANLLLLDEPTNHLDIYSREILEKALRAYGGTLLFISHDRYFINRVADKIIELTPKGADSYGGGYEYYLEKKPADTPVKEVVRQKRDRSERRRRGRADKLEAEIAALELELKNLDKLLHEGGSDFERLNQLYQEKLKLEGVIEGLYGEWAGLD